MSTAKAGSFSRRQFLAAPLLAAREGADILLDVRSRRLVAVHNAAVADRFLAPPGSTVKPLVLRALLRNGRLTAAESVPCPGRLTIAGRSFDCSHPRMDTPMRVETAIAYSCNYFVAHMADRFQPGELEREYARAGLASTGRIRQAVTRDAVRLLALGEDGIVTTLSDLASAYRNLALQPFAPILTGMEGAVEYGTAQRAQIKGVKVAGKTGSVIAASGAPIAWFAGFMPSRTPEVVVAVMLQGHSGGADAAPLAASIFQSYQSRPS